MTRHFFNELEALKRDLLSMGGLVENAVAQATTAFLESSDEFVEQIVAGDSEIDALELRVEEECLKILALYGPTAKDLRFVVAVFKITNDLERIADMAVNIAKRAQGAALEGVGPVGADVREMSERVRRMVRKSLDAFVSLDSSQAREILQMTIAWTSCCGRSTRLSAPRWNRARRTSRERPACSASQNSSSALPTMRRMSPKT